MLGGAGFHSASDIEGITVNRWVHGYAFTPNPLFDPDWKEEEKPWVIGRKPFGEMAIANLKRADLWDGQSSRPINLLSGPARNEDAAIRREV